MKRCFRVSELLHLRINDVDYPDPIDKTGNIYLIERANESLDRLLKQVRELYPYQEICYKQWMIILYHRPQKAAVDYIFVSHSKGNTSEPISRKCVETMFTAIERESRISY